MRVYVHVCVRVHACVCMHAYMRECMSFNFPVGYCVFVFFPEHHLMVGGVCPFINSTTGDITQAAEDQL